MAAVPPGATRWPNKRVWRHILGWLALVTILLWVSSGSGVHSAEDPVERSRAELTQDVLLVGGVLLGIGWAATLPLRREPKGRPMTPPVPGAPPPPPPPAPVSDQLPDQSSLGPASDTRAAPGSGVSSTTLTSSPGERYVALMNARCSREELHAALSADARRHPDLELPDDLATRVTSYLRHGPPAVSRVPPGRATG